MNREIKYKGYEISQAYNNHITITKDNKMVLHGQVNKKLDNKELKKQIKWFLNIIEPTSQMFFDELIKEENE